ncbi:MAG: hypothetical protein ABJD11_02560 [Gemmatimonadota bacterium]
MKPIFLGVAAFLLSLGATTGVMVVRHRKAPAVAAVPGGKDSTAVHADSAHAKPAKGEPLAAHDTVKALPDSARHAVRADSAKVDSASTPAVAEIKPPIEGPGPLVSAAAAAHSADPKARALAYKQLARIFSAMKPVEAVKVLGFLSDAEVEGILRAVGPRQAADFLVNLPKERAAALSRRLLVPVTDAEAAK